MIELKVYVPQDGPYGLVPEEGGAPVEEETCYLKSEADKLIAELKNQQDGAFGLANLGLTLDDLSQMAKKETDHQKYKRWLKIAKKFKEAMPIEVKTYKEAESGNSKRED